MSTDSPYLRAGIAVSGHAPATVWQLVDEHGHIRPPARRQAFDRDDDVCHAFDNGTALLERSRPLRKVELSEWHSNDSFGEGHIAQSKHTEQPDWITFTSRYTF
jgi:hypothetical protein